MNTFIKTHAKLSLCDAFFGSINVCKYLLGVLHNMCIANRKTTQFDRRMFNFDRVCIFKLQSTNGIKREKGKDETKTKVDLFLSLQKFKYNDFCSVHFKIPQFSV